MTEETVQGTPRSYSGALLATIAVALLLGIGGVIWSYTISTQLTAQKQAIADSGAQNAKQMCIRDRGSLVVRIRVSRAPHFGVHLDP